MINMMYLVLTALLALNVTKEILLAFTVIDNSLKKSTANIEVKTVQMVSQLQKISGDNQAAKAALGYCNDANKTTSDLLKIFVKSKHTYCVIPWVQLIQTIRISNQKMHSAFRIKPVRITNFLLNFLG